MRLAGIVERRVFGEGVVEGDVAGSLAGRDAVRNIGGRLEAINLLDVVGHGGILPEPADRFADGDVHHGWAISKS